MALLMFINPVFSDGHIDIKKQSTNNIAAEDLVLRRATLINKVPYCTNMSTAQVCLKGIKSLKTKKITVTSLQDI